MAQDRVGIVRDVSSALASVSGNISHISETVMRGYFTLILSVEMPDERTQAEIRQAVERKGAVGELEVSVRPFVAVPECESCCEERLTFSMQGTDQPGLIARTTTYFAENSINIEDVYAYVQNGKTVILAQVAVPAGIDIGELQAGLREVLKGIDVVAHLQHENIFKATSEVQPVLRLQRLEQ